MHKKYIQQLRFRYGLTPAQYRSLYTKQDGKCFLCKTRPPGGPGQRVALFVDHDHKSGRVRKLLCRRCNNGLGAFQDDPVLLARAIEYLTGVHPTVLVNTRLQKGSIIQYHRAWHVRYRHTDETGKRSSKSQILGYVRDHPDISTILPLRDEFMRRYNEGKNMTQFIRKELKVRLGKASIFQPEKPKYRPPTDVDAILVPSGL